MKIPPALRRLLIAVRGRTETYVKPATLPMYGLRGVAAQLTGPSRRLKLRQLRSGVRRLRNRWVILAVLFEVRLTMAFQFQSVAAVARLLGSEFGVILADTRILIGLCFTPSLAGIAIGRRRQDHCSRGIDPDADRYPCDGAFGFLNRPAESGVNAAALPNRC
jgi:hypothetical protein